MMVNQATRNPILNTCGDSPNGPGVIDVDPPVLGAVDHAIAAGDSPSQQIFG
jgi:hypothetical protein